MGKKEGVNMILNENEFCFTQHVQNRTYSFFSLKLMGLSAISFVALYAQFSGNQTRVGIISGGSLPLTPLPN